MKSTWLRTGAVAWFLAAGLVSSLSSSAEEAEPETFGAAPDALGPIGGGKGYTKLVAKGDFHVKTEDELVDALAKAKPGQVVYVDDAAELDFTVRVRAQQFVLELPGGVTLAGGRGKGDCPGGLIMSDEFATSPLIRVTGEKARVTGLRIQGPDPKMRWEELPRLIKVGGSDLYYKFPTSDGIQSSHAHLEVDNCEISGWGHGGVFLPKGGTNAHIHHNTIHHCWRRGLGYGVSLDAVEALIESNLFDSCRHAIAATGAPGTAYEARNNVVEETGVLHSFDMHGGGDRKDGTEAAGEWLKVHHNTFKARWKGGNYVWGVYIRGRPAQGSEIHHNWFLTDRHDKAAQQIAGENMKMYRNQFGKEREVK